MDEARESGWRLKPKHYLFIVLPVLAFVLTNAMLPLAEATKQLAVPSVRDGHAEAAGRIRVLATFLLFLALGATTFVYALRCAMRLERRSCGSVMFLYGASVVLGFAIVHHLGITKGDKLFETSFACASYTYLEGGPRPVPPPGARADASDLTAACGRSEARAVPPRGRTPDGLETIRLLFAVASLILIFAMPAILWGAVACLALPDDGPRRLRAAGWRAQTERLNRLLYLSSAFMVAGLLYASARYSWPAHSLGEADAKTYGQHVASLVLYLGVANSVMIAAFYLPVAASLRDSRPPPPPAWPPRGGSDPAGDADPFGPSKKAIALFTPAFVGIVTGLLKFS